MGVRTIPCTVRCLSNEIEVRPKPDRRTRRNHEPRLFNLAHGAAHGGTFILRIEDTDVSAHERVRTRDPRGLA